MENEVLKKARSVLCQRSSVTDKFEFIDAEYANFTWNRTSRYVPSIVEMCIWMGGPRVPGFYECGGMRRNRQRRKAAGYSRCTSG